MVSFTTLLTLSATALASPVLQARQIAIPETWKWQVSKWEAGCTRGGCYYHFDVTIPAIENRMGAIAHCDGTENGYYMKGNWYESCEIQNGLDNGVSAKLSERVPDTETTSGGPKEILISFRLDGTENSPTYNFTGSHEIKFNAFVAPQMEFEVTPTEVSGVA